VPHIKSERLRALAVGGARRATALPDVPTINESGYAFDASSWYGVLGPRNLPPYIVDRLHSTLVRTLRAPAMQSRLQEIAFAINATTPAEFTAHLRAETTTWGKVIDASAMRNK
jgi:tripartite-type tricarboxylate transporter receptor subunit TctC